MKKLMLTMLSVVGMMLFVALPAKACTSYYVGKDCTKDGTTMYGRTEDYSPKKDKVYKVIQPKKVGKNATFKDETGATTFQAPIKVETTYRYTICRDSEGAEDGYFGEFGTNTKGVSMSATTSSSVAKTVGKFDPYIDAYESKVGGITEENLTDYVLCQASSAREGVELLADVIDTVGAGEGDGLFIADQNEVWYFEILTGHNYCAIKMPSDKAAIIPNCFVIGDVDLSDKANVVASPNLVKLAKNNGFYVAAQDGKGDINVKLSYSGKGYAAHNADRIRGGQYLLSGQDNTGIYDVSKAYKTEAQQPNSRAAYWIFRNIGYLCEETNDGDGPNRENYGKGVKQFYKAYMTKMEELQKNVNAQMLNVYKNDKKNLEYYATKLGIAIGNETMDFAKAMYMDIQTCKTNGTKYETSSLSADDIEYDLSMVTAPAKKADDTKPVTPAKSSAPARVQVRAKALKGKKVKVSLKKTAEAKGYEIVYSTNVNFTKKTTKKISTKNLTKTIKKLKKKKTYYIKARAYKLDGKTKVYGRWSLIRKVTIKK